MLMVQVITRSMPAGHGGAEGRGENQGNATLPQQLCGPPTTLPGWADTRSWVPMTRQNGCLSPRVPHDLAP